MRIFLSSRLLQSKEVTLGIFKALGNIGDRKLRLDLDSHITLLGNFSVLLMASGISGNSAAISWGI